MILAGIDNMSSSSENHVALWRWESGIKSNTGASRSNNSTGISAVTPSAIIQGAALDE